jgi:hypothetical protein
MFNSHCMILLQRHLQVQRLVEPGYYSYFIALSPFALYVGLSQYSADARILKIPSAVPTVKAPCSY